MITALPVGGGVTGVVGEYLRRSRSATYGVLFALPLLVAYEALAATMNAGEALHLRNAADVILRRALALTGAHTTFALTALLVVAGALLVLRERRRDPAPLVARYFAWMLGESAVLALLFGGVVGTLTRLVLAPLAGSAGAGAVALAAGAAPGRGAQIVLALGAGLYEELLFRVLLVPLLALALTAAGMARGNALAAAAVLSALAFSAAHYLGPLGDPFALGSFVFRFLGGLAFGAILVLRGFGIVAWTHALYDVFLILGGG